MEHIYTCPRCKAYTMATQCSRCELATLLARPPKFSLDDKYASYRRELRRKELREKGLY